MVSGNRCQIIAEIGASHNQDFGHAVKLVLGAKEAGADAVKVQMYRPGSLTIDSDDPRFQITEGPWAGQSLYQLYEKTCMPYEWVPLLKQIAEELGLFFFTSVYDAEAVDIAESYGIASYKISSFEINHEALLEKVAQTGKSVYLSCGCASLPELYRATRVLRRYHRNLILLHCVSHYPARAEDMNLRTIYELGRYCNGKAGLSDHTDGIIVPACAAAMGIVALEKHIRIGESPDFWALEPAEFARMVESVRIAEASQGVIRMGGSAQYKRQLIDGQWVRCSKTAPSS